jgi:hypothetical protein
MTAMHTLSRLLKPMAYLQVRHRAKNYYDYWLPLAGGTVVGIAVLFGGIHVNVFGEYGIVHGINQLLQLLVGFYVAALAAVATFQGPGMDEFTAGDPLFLGQQQLSRRRYVCLLFGHLAVVGFGLYVVGVFAMASAPALKAAVGTAEIGFFFGIAWSFALRAVFTFLHLWVSAHLFVVTLYGVYYLAVRMHTVPRPLTRIEKAA